MSRLLLPPSSCCSQLFLPLLLVIPAKRALLLVVLFVDAALQQQKIGPFKSLKNMLLCGKRALTPCPSLASQSTDWVWSLAERMPFCSKASDAPKISHISRTHHVTNCPLGEVFRGGLSQQTSGQCISNQADSLIEGSKPRMPGNSLLCRLRNHQPRRWAGWEEVSGNRSRAWY